MYTYLDMKTFLFLDLNWQYLNLISAFLFYKENLKIYKGKYASEHFGSHFSHIGLINLISWPCCHIFTDALGADDLRALPEVALAMAIVITDFCYLSLLAQTALRAPPEVALQCVAGHCFCHCSLFFFFFPLFFLRHLLLTHFGETLEAEILLGIKRRNMTDKNIYFGG